MAELSYVAIHNLNQHTMSLGFGDLNGDRDLYSGLSFDTTLDAEAQASGRPWIMGNLGGVPRIYYERGKFTKFEAIAILLDSYKWSLQ